MTATTTRIRTLLGILLAATMILLCGCGFNPSNYSMPGSGLQGPTYRLNLEFDSLLSLPAGAEVRSGGISVGSLDTISLGPRSATAHIDVDDSVRILAGTRAELRQTTVMGDIYIALLAPTAEDAAPLQDGDTIPLADTDTGPQIEEMLERIATFVNGGSMTRLQDSIGRINEVLPEDPAQTRDLAADISTDMSDAAANLDDLDRIVVATGELSERLHGMRDEVGFIFSDVARRRLDRVPYFMEAVLNTVIDVNKLTNGLEWLIPRLPHINENLDILVPLVREPSPSAKQWEGNSGEMVALANDKLIPFLLGPGVDIRQITIAGNGGDPNKDGLVLLRMIGVLP